MGKSSKTQRSDFSKYYKGGFCYKLWVDVTLDILEKIGTPRSLALAIMIRHKELCHELFEVTPSAYFAPFDYFLDAQAIALVKKTQYLRFKNVDKDDIKCESVSRFISIEHDMESINKVILSRKNYELNGILFSASRILQNILPKIETIMPRCMPIPHGATASLKGLDVNIANKLKYLDITSSALHHYHRYYGDSLLCFKNYNVKIVKGCKFETVPKTVTQYRTIAKEPMGNMMLQLDAAKSLRIALRRVGIDLRNQQEFHKFIVRNYWTEYATIDLKDASDRISSEIIRELLPPDWYDYLNSIRSKNIVVGDSDHVLQKFCAQGNGFNFELETLVFYAVCRYIVPNKYLVSVYGDDMIVPKQYAQKVMHTLEVMGLVINRTKSYDSGLFRESCGEDTFSGVSVRPVFFKTFSKGLYGFYELYNRIVDVEKHFCPDYLIRAKKRVLSTIDLKHRAFGPTALGDIVLHGEFKFRYKNYIRLVRSLQTSIPDEESPEGEITLPQRDLPPDQQLSYALLNFSSRGTPVRGFTRHEIFDWCPYP